MIKQGARLGKVCLQKAHVLQKIVLYFKGVTVNIGDHSQWNRSLHLREKQHKQFPTPQKEKPTAKKRRREKARSSAGRSFEKSHNTKTKFHFRKITITSEDYKIFFYISKKKKITISKATLHIGQQPVKAKTTRKRKKRRKGNRKKGRKRKKRRKGKRKKRRKRK